MRYSAFDGSTGDAPGVGGRKHYVNPGAMERPLTTPDTGTAPLPRILIVEDDADSVTTLRRLLRLHGYEAEAVRDGASALERLRAGVADCDVVLCDLALGGPISGYDLAANLRREPACRHLALVAYTGFADEQSRQLAEAAGFDAFLVKPTEGRAIVDTCRACFQARTATLETGSASGTTRRGQ